MSHAKSKLLEMRERLERMLSPNDAYVVLDFCIDELIESHRAYAGKENDYQFWKQVKEELENL